VREVPVPSDDELAQRVETFLALLARPLERHVADVATSPVGDD